MSKYLWGIDLGGTKIEGVVISAGSPKEVTIRKRISTESYKGYNHILSQIKHLVNDLKAQTGLLPEKIGFGTPGAIDSKTNVIKNSNTTCLIGKPLKKDLEKILNVRAFFANDANCFALAETLLGVVNEKKLKPQVVFGVIMGTGVGGGLVVNGNIINGLHGIAGEWGHNFLDESGGRCYCAKFGCVETILSGPALEKFYFSQSGIEKKLPHIVTSANKGELHAVKTLERLHHFFGLAISQVCNTLDPDVIVLGGGVGNVASLYSEGFKSLKKFIFNEGVANTKILKPALGDSAGVFGAALLTTQNPQEMV